MLSTPGRKACAAVAGGAWITGGYVAAQMVQAPAGIARPDLNGELVVSLIVAVTFTLCVVLRARMALMERAYSLGYDAGLHDGLRCGKAATHGDVVVQFPRSS